MTQPPYPGETFRDTVHSRSPESGPNGSMPAEPNGSAPLPDLNGTVIDMDNFDETRPRSAFGVPGSGPAGGFEPHPLGPPPLHRPLGEVMPPQHADAAGDDGFSAPTTITAGDPSLRQGMPPPPIGPAEMPTAFGEPPHGFEPPPGAFGDPTIGYGGLPPGPDYAMGNVGPMGPPPIGMDVHPPPYVPEPPRPVPARPLGPRARGPRRAKLQLRHINPWTVLKFSCVLSVALFFVWLITIGLLYGILQAAGVVDHINSAVTTINGSGSKDPVTPGLVFGGSAIIGVINIVLFVALSTVGSVVYNLCADLVGGVEVTLSERD